MRASRTGRGLRVDADVVELARLPTSRPGQLLLAGDDLHAVVFEAGDMANEPSSGGLRSYAVARDGSGSTMAKVAAASNIRKGLAWAWMGLMMLMTVWMFVGWMTPAPRI